MGSVRLKDEVTVPPPRYSPARPPALLNPGQLRGETLFLKSHAVRDRLYAIDTTCNLDGFVDVDI